MKIVYSDKHAQHDPQSVPDDRHPTGNARRLSDVTLKASLPHSR